MRSFRVLPHILVVLLTVPLLAVVPAVAQFTGPDVPEMANYDVGITNFIEGRGIPGAAVAVSKDGRLVYARGFGMADVEAGAAVQPDSRFRIASISKSVTAVAVMRLVEEGLLELDAPAFAFLDHLQPAEGATEDARLAAVTVRDLLQHSGGWDRDGTGYDPMFDVVNIANTMGAAAPADCETVIRYMRGRPLDFDPGTRYSYSNFGYCALGRIVERVTGEDYDVYVRGLLAEAGIEGMEVGRSLLSDRLPGEVRYYPDNITTSVFDGSAVSWPYGGFHIEAMDAHGGWVASAVDLLRLSSAIDGLANRADVLTPASLAAISARPDVPSWSTSSYWYGLGWQVNTNGHWWHNGSLPGLESLLVRSNYQGLHWAVLLNHRPANASPHIAAIDALMWELALAVTTWPAHDLFAESLPAEDGPGRGVLMEAAAPYPNPARDVVTIELDVTAPGIAQIEVFDVMGRRVARHEARIAPGASNRTTMQTSSLPPGLYVVRVSSTDGQTSSHRFTVVR